MNNDILKKIHAGLMKKRPDVKVGDTVRLHMRISEGDNSRIQVFQGIVLAIKGSGLDATITVRKITFGIGVERIVPLHSPTLEKIEVIKRGKVRRSKLYYMRDRVGKRAMKIAGSETLTEVLTDEVEEEVEEEVVAEAENVEAGAENAEVEAAAADNSENSSENE